MQAHESPRLDVLSDLQTPWCIHVVATLRIAEHIADGTSDVGELATAADCDRDALESVLGHLVSKGVFEQPAPGTFALNDTARGLLDPSNRIGLDLTGIGGRMAFAWGTLFEYVRTGKPAYDRIFGLPFWEDLDAHPDIAASFDALMGPLGHGTPDPEILLDADWQSVHSVVDVGGGTGALLGEILRAYPHVRGTLIDLSRTIARSHDTFAAAGVADRVTTTGQSFFDLLPAGASVYVLSMIINDWPDEEARAILQRCAEAARPAGRVVILSGVSPKGAPKRLGPDMVMAGGKERTLDEFRALAHAAGLEVHAAGPNATRRYIVECRPSHASS